MAAGRGGFDQREELLRVFFDEAMRPLLPLGFSKLVFVSAVRI